MVGFLLVFLWLLAMLFQHQKFKVWLGEHLFQCCLVLSPRFLSSGLKWCTVNVLISSGLHFLVHKFDPYIHTDFSIVLWSQIPLHPPTMSFDGPLSPFAFKAAYCTFSISKISILMRWAFATTLIGTLAVLHVSYFPAIYIVSLSEVKCLFRIVFVGAAIAPLTFFIFIWSASVLEMWVTDLSSSTYAGLYAYIVSPF